MIDIEKLEKLSGLHYENKQKITKDINSILAYLGKLSEIKIDESEYIYYINDASRNSGVEEFTDTKKLLNNSHHDKINNSVVLKFK